MNASLILMTALLVKHFIADFPLQNRYMLGKFKRVGWVLPLVAHSSVHVALSIVVLLAVGVGPLLTLLLATGEGVAHFVIDRVKAHPDLGGRWKPDQANFWNALGFDQLMHNVTYVAMTAIATL